MACWMGTSNLALLPYRSFPVTLPFGYFHVSLRRERPVLGDTVKHLYDFAP